MDRTTGNPTEQGQGVTLDSVTDTVLLPSANDHFVYATGYDATISEYLWVYATARDARRSPPYSQPSRR